MCSVPWEGKGRTWDDVGVIGGLGEGFEGGAYL